LPYFHHFSWIFVILWKSIRTELFSRIRIHSLLFREKKKLGFFHVKDFNFWGLDKKIKLVFFSSYYTSIRFLFLWKAITTEYFVSMYYTSFFVISWKQYKFCFFHVKERFNICGFVKTIKHVFFPRITHRFDFCFCENLQEWSFFPCITLHFLCVLWKTIQIVFLSMFFIFILWLRKQQKIFLFPCIIYSNSIIFCWNLKQPTYFHVLDFNFCGL